MSKANSKSFNSLRQKLRKYNKDFESEITAYREGPDPVGYSSGAGESDGGEHVYFVKLYAKQHRELFLGKRKDR
jgi:hypothetical protein